jgi:hypothetical protein
VEVGDEGVEARNLPLGVQEVENLSSVLVAMQRLASSTQRFHFLFSYIRNILFMLTYSHSHSLAQLQSVFSLSLFVNSKAQAYTRNSPTHIIILI